MARNDLTIYDDAAAQWWSDELRWVRTLKNMVPARLKWFDTFIDWDGKQVLDLGCAGGFMSEALYDRGAQVTGIDPAEDAIEAARAHAEDEGKFIRYEVTTGEEMPYDDDAFDAIVCVDVLEHVSDLEQVMRQCARVLRPGGHFFFDTINRNILARFVVITMAEDVFGILPKGTHDPGMFIKPGELDDLCSRVGLEPLTTVGLGPTGLNRRGDFTFGRLPVTLIQYMGAARKPS